jgi:hypothetical protein
MRGVLGIVMAMVGPEGLGQRRGIEKGNSWINFWDDMKKLPRILAPGPAQRTKALIAPILTKNFSLKPNALVEDRRGVLDQRALDG